jgi:regulator of protease activity HflC (stomatin/prohibitin superfamily)
MRLETGTANLKYSRLLRLWLLSRRRIMLAVLAVMAIVVAAGPEIFITIPAGHAGVLWLRLWGGTVTDSNALNEGLHLISPWNRIYIYDARARVEHQTLNVVAGDGLQITVTVNLRWEIRRDHLGRLHKEVGPDYVDRVLLPEVASLVRHTFSRFTTEEIYSVKRNVVEKEILDSIGAPYLPGNVDASGDASTYIKPMDLYTSLILPPEVQAAMERKQQQAQLAQSYEYRIEAERQESMRKAIEAEGIRSFQQTVQAGISNNYLRWRGIEATLALATSPNAKVVVIGGSQGLPLILNTGDLPSVPGVATATPASASSASVITASPNNKVSQNSRPRDTASSSLTNSSQGRDHDGGNMMHFLRGQSLQAAH